MDCKKLQNVFATCSKPYYPNPASAQEHLANEAQKYNCILLSNTINDYCKQLTIPDLSKNVKGN